VVKSWHTEQVKELRSVDGSQAWLTRQIAEGGYIEHIALIFKKLSHTMSLEKAGFIVDAGMAKKAEAGANLIEDEIADVYGTFCLAMANARCRRGLYYFGPPYCMVNVFSSSAGRFAGVLQRFRDDMDIWTRLKNLEEKSKLHETLINRHLFAKISNQQIIAAMNELGWAIHPDFTALIRSRVRGAISTVAVEEMIGTAKNTRSTKANRKFRRPETSIHVSCRFPVPKTLLLQFWALTFFALTMR
jgi:hypothetical protein